MPLFYTTAKMKFILHSVQKPHKNIFTTLRLSNQSFTLLKPLSRTQWTVAYLPSLCQTESMFCSVYIYISFSQQQKIDNCSNNLSKLAKLWWNKKLRSYYLAEFQSLIKNFPIYRVVRVVKVLATGILEVQDAEDGTLKLFT